MQFQNIFIPLALSISLSLAPLPFEASADEASEASETILAEHDEELPEVSAPKRELPEQITIIGKTRGSDTYFDAETLWLGAPVDAGEALKAVPGVSIIRKGGYANDLVLRGFTKDRLNLTIDGQKVHGACSNRMDPPILQVDPSEIEALELVKGPFDVRNPGSMGGLVRLRTKDPKEGTHGSLKLGAASFDHQDVAGSLSHGGEKISGLVGGAFRQGDPYKTGGGDRITEIYDDTDPNRYLDSAKRDKAFEANNLWSKIILKPQDGHKVGLSVSRQHASDVIYPYLIMDATKDETLRAALNYDWDFQEEENVLPGLTKLHFAIHWDDADHDMDNDKRANMMDMESEADSSTASARFHAEFAALGGTLTSGVDYMERDWDITTRMQMMMNPVITQNMIPDTTQENVGLFLDFERDLPYDLTLNTGLRVDYSETEAGEEPTGAPGMGVSYNDYWSGSDDKSDDTEVSGNIRLTWEASDQYLLFAGLGRGVRMPDALERYVARGVMTGNNWIGNPNLKPEKNHEIDVGFTFTGERLYTSATAFASHVDDYVALVQKSSTGVGMVASNDATTYDNTDADLWGAELQAAYVLTDLLSLYGDAEFVRGRKDRNDLIQDRDLAEIPPLHGRVGLRLKKDKEFYAELEAELANNQNNVDSDLNESKTSSWSIANFRVGAKVGEHVQLDSGVRNIFNREYSTHLSYLRNPFSSGVRLVEPGRSFYLKLSANF